MLFNSLDFAIFFPLVFIFYWIVSKNLTARNVLILVSSYVFYGWWDWRFLSLIIISSLIDYFVGKKIYDTDSKRKKRQLLLVSLVVNLGFLLYFKYANFFIDTFVDSFALFGKELEVSTLNIILPVGISFYTFQTLSYTIDIYRGQLKPTTNPLAFFSFVAFFPQLVAGPIERASHLLPQFYKTYKFNYGQVKSGLLLMAFGLFKKMVIADRAAILVNQVYNNPSDYHGYEVVIATVLFAFQIYCDFSGYSDIAIGAARTMGFDLMKNFDSPYFSKSITEFWRRWHISLSTWFRDYVYIPLGGSRKGKYRTYFNLFAVFLISGLWHGAAMTFVIWGAIHGTIIVIEKALGGLRQKMFTRKGHPLSYLIGIPITFTIVCFAWIFFRANSFMDAKTIVKQASESVPSINSIYDLGLPNHEFKLLFVAILLLLLFEIIHKRFNALKVLNKIILPVRWVAYLLIVFSVLIFGIYGEDTLQEFIYFQF
jgi:D-alanyl-lipoteichoic acid acyltransferase DltB (MBOAT superfamily)